MQRRVFFAAMLGTAAPDRSHKLRDAVAIQPQLRRSARNHDPSLQQRLNAERYTKRCRYASLRPVSRSFVLEKRSNTDDAVVMDLYRL